MKTALIALSMATIIFGVSVASAQTATSTMAMKDVYITATPTDVLSSNIIDLDIQNSRKETIGKIKDVIMSNGKLAGYIVSVGGFLGMGEHYVIVNPMSVKLNYSEDDKKWSAMMETTKEALKAAPGFKYEGRWAK